TRSSARTSVSGSGLRRRACSQHRLQNRGRRLARARTRAGLTHQLQNLSADRPNRPENPMPTDHIAYIGIAANLGDAIATVRQALGELAALDDVFECTAARLYRSAPLEAAGPDFINSVARLRTRLDAFALLTALQTLEDVHGRKRPYRNAPRTLDLD